VGRKRAQAAGVKFGRKRKLSDYQRAEAVKRRAAGETLASIAIDGLLKILARVTQAERAWAN
jgi:hypothetical protein